MPFYITLHYFLHLANFIAFPVSCSVRCKYHHHVDIELSGDICIAFDPKSYHYVLRSKSKFLISLMIFECSVTILYIKLKHYQKQSPWDALWKKLLKFLQTSQENACVAAQRPANLWEKRLQDRCFLENFAKYLRIPFLQNTFCDCFSSTLLIYLVCIFI